MHETQLRIWAVYRHPTDYPNKYVAREFVGETATRNIIVTDDLPTLREIMCFELHLTRLARFPEDEPQVVETWL